MCRNKKNLPVEVGWQTGEFCHGDGGLRRCRVEYRLAFHNQGSECGMSVLTGLVVALKLFCTLQNTNRSGIFIPKICPRCFCSREVSWPGHEFLVGWFRTRLRANTELPGPCSPEKIIDFLKLSWTLASDPDWH